MIKQSVLKVRINSYIEKITRILENSSDETIELVYNMLNDLYRYNKKTDK